MNDIKNLIREAKKQLNDYDQPETYEAQYHLLKALESIDQLSVDKHQKLSRFVRTQQLNRSSANLRLV